MDIKWWESVEYYLIWALASSRSRRLAHRRRIMARYVFMGGVWAGIGMREGELSDESV
jgi:hypothetical protein